MGADKPSYLRTLSDGTPDEQLAALWAIRRGLALSVHDRDIFRAARACVGSSHNDVRWQSLIVLGEFLPLRLFNDEIWEVVLENLGVDEDMHDALSTVILEHLLQYDFERTYARLLGARLTRDDALYDVLLGCWDFCDGAGQWARVEELIRAAEAAERPSHRAAEAVLRGGDPASIAATLAAMGRRGDDRPWVKAHALRFLSHDDERVANSARVALSHTTRGYRRGTSIFVYE